MKLTKEEIINAPVERVFEFISKPEARPLFVPNLAGIENVSPEEQGVGQAWEFQFSLFGVSLSGKGSCTVYEPSSQYGLRTEGGISSRWLYALTPEGNGTRLRVEVEYDPPGSVMAKIANAALLSRIQDNEAERGVQNLKIILED